ncbi:unnamed protein product [Phytophthora fragariaefolia]|uniref:Unnamed protein product n=1 Tax=Phytophthora fragariaefolia TaxID=1490495 RepID=A0A9W6XJA7_9STRA|nr:unnamed protein product [Phytophthora fragariaefolia]
MLVNTRGRGPMEDFRKYHKSQMKRSQIRQQNRGLGDANSNRFNLFADRFNLFACECASPNLDFPKFWGLRNLLPRKLNSRGGHPDFTGQQAALPCSTMLCLSLSWPEAKAGQHHRLYTCSVLLSRSCLSARTSGTRSNFSTTQTCASMCVMPSVYHVRPSKYHKLRNSLPTTQGQSPDPPSSLSVIAFCKHAPQPRSADVVATLDATTAAGHTQATVVQAVDLAGARESFGDGQRFLRTNSKKSTGVDEDKEERMFQTAKIMARLQFAKSIDDVGPILRDVRDYDVIKKLFGYVEPHMKQALPGFHKDISYENFDDLLQASTLSNEVKAILTTIFSKYWNATH